MDLFPTGYEWPKKAGSNYTKFEKWETKLRLMSPFLMWFVYFTNENKPKRSVKQPHNPSDIWPKSKVKEFWATKVYNYTTEKIEVCEITQATIKNNIFAYQSDSDLPSLTECILKISKSWEGLDTTYSVTCIAKAPEEDVLEASKTTPVDLSKLMTWDNPFDVAEGDSADELAAAITSV